MSNNIKIRESVINIGRKTKPKSIAIIRYFNACIQFENEFTKEIFGHLVRQSESHSCHDDLWMITRTDFILEFTYMGTFSDLGNLTIFINGASMELGTGYISHPTSSHNFFLAYSSRSSAFLCKASNPIDLWYSSATGRAKKLLWSSVPCW